MKQDLSISSLFQKIRDLSMMKRDYLVPTNELSVTTGDGVTSLNISGTTYKLQARAANQLANIIRMPYSYYQRLEKDYPCLLDTNVNTLLNKCSKNRLVRTLGGNARAILSDRYKKIEHEDLLNIIMPLINDIDGMEIVATSLNSERMYLKAICRYEKAEVKVGDTVSFGIVCTNSEVGTSSVVISPYVERLVCSNGMVLPAYYGSSRKIHLGKRIDDIDSYDNLNEGMADNLTQTIHEQMSKILDSEYYLKAVEKMKYSTEIFVQDLTVTLEKLAKAYGLDTGELELIKYYFTLNKDGSLWALVNAVTEASKQSSTYERAHQLEVIGSRILYDGVDAMKTSNANNLYLVG